MLALGLDRSRSLSPGKSSLTRSTLFQQRNTNTMPWLGKGQPESQPQ